MATYLVRHIFNEQNQEKKNTIKNWLDDCMLDMSIKAPLSIFDTWLAQAESDDLFDTGVTDLVYILVRLWDFVK